MRKKQIQLHLECIDALSGVRRKISWVVFHSMAYSSHLHLVCSVCDGHNLTSYSCFQTNVLANFFDITCIFFCTYSPYCISHCTDYKLSALQVRISVENKLHATTQQLITAKISGCLLKQGSETHSSLGQNNLQLQNETALMCSWIRAVEYKKCAAGLAVAPRQFARSNLANLHKNCKCALRKNTSNCLLCIQVQQLLVFRIPCWYIVKSLKASTLTTADFGLVQQFYHATETAGNVANAVSACPDQPQQTK